MDTLYDAVGGRPALDALAHAWHERCLADPVASHPFSHPGHAQHLERLAAYWAEQLGGPPQYTSAMGTHVHVLRMHAGNGDHPDLDEAALACFSAAVDDVGLRADPAVGAELERWFRWATTDLMNRYPRSPDDVPSGEPLPRWPDDAPSPTG